jgi:2-polyprenyl-3-methyl-5-hydroxy-6-metoxy-1,4-benzoquinol methylase
MEICKVCGASELLDIPGFDCLSRVTSDCRPWPAGGRLVVCQKCDAVQKPIDEKWQSEARRLYNEYKLYSISDERDQIVFDAEGRPQSRSERVVERLVARFPGWHKGGRILDAGCGEGAFLSAFGERLQTWSLTGWDVSEKVRKRILSIPKAKFYCFESILDVPGEFDLISMTHVLEHVTKPLEFLSEVKQKLAPGGQIFVQVPHFRESPFDLLVADHCSHFDEPSLYNLFSKMGLQITSYSTNWIRKEISLVACLSGSTHEFRSIHRGNALETVQGHMKWLSLLVAQAKAEIMGKSFGIFGTALGAVWLDQELEETAVCFLDEDRSRVGRTFLGRPVRHPSEDLQGMKIIIPMPADTAEKISLRLAVSDANYRFMS